MCGDRITYKLAAYFLILLVFNSFAVANKVIYVDDDASGANDGSSWQNAYIYLQDALTDAKSSEKPVEIRVAQGIYKPDQGAGQTAGNREASFELINNVTLSGGYGGISEIDPDEWDYEKYKTVLSGDLAGNNIELNNTIELENEPTREDNSYYVITTDLADGSSVIDGAIISGGNGKIVAVGRGNIPGGGIKIVDGKLRISNCNFTNNAGYGGGGVYIQNGELSLINCNFVNNFALQGGALENNKGKLLVTGCVFTNNKSADKGGAIYGSGENYIIKNSIFSANSATNGGAIFNSGSLTKLEVTNCDFIDNSANSGAGIYNDRSFIIVLKNCNFKHNSANHGGGIYNNNKMNLYNCVFDENMAIGYGGAIYIYPGNISSDIANCTFIYNSAYEGKAVAVYRPTCSNCDINIFLTNCIIRNGTKVIWNNSSSIIQIKYCNIENGINSTDNLMGQLIWGDGNIDIEPLFTDPKNLDYHLKSQAGRYDPNTQSWMIDEVTSPCIDAGDPNSPTKIEPFPNGGYINMGAYGGTPEASKSYFGEPLCETIIAGDINGDCKVNETDFEILMNHWLEDHSLYANPFTEFGIEYYVQTDKSSYTLGENVQMLFRVTNKTSETVSIRCMPMPVTDFIVQKDGSNIWQYNGLFFPAGTNIELSAGESLEESCVWNMKDNDGYLVDAGTYQVVGIMYNGSWNYESHNYDERKSTEVKTTITISSNIQP